MSIFYLVLGILPEKEKEVFQLLEIIKILKIN
jgi:hypothetical protein